MVNEVTFVGFRRAIAPPGSAPGPLAMIVVPLSTFRKSLESKVSGCGFLYFKTGNHRKTSEKRKKTTTYWKPNEHKKYKQNVGFRTLQPSRTASLEDRLRGKTNVTITMGVLGSLIIVLDVISFFSLSCFSLLNFLVLFK